MPSLTPRQVLLRLRSSRSALANLEQASDVLGDVRRRDRLATEATRQEAILDGLLGQTTGSQRKAIEAMTDYARILERRLMGLPEH